MGARKRIRERSRQIGDEAWAITQVWECAEADTARHARELWLSRPIPLGQPDMNSRQQPVPVSIEVMDNEGADGFDWIVCKFRTLTVEEYMDRHAPIGILLGNHGLRGERIRKCRSCDTVIQGREVAFDNGQPERAEWVVEQGPQTRMVPLPTYTIRAIVDNWHTYIERWIDNPIVGKVNSSPMGKLGDAGRNDVLCTRMAFQPSPYSNAWNKWIVEWDFMRTGQGVPWNHTGYANGLFITRKFVHRVFEEPVVDLEGNDTGLTRHVWQLVPTNIWEYHDLYEERNWNTVYRLISRPLWGV